MNVHATAANHFDYWFADDIVHAIRRIADTAATMGLDAATVDKVLTLFAAAFGLEVSDETAG